MMITLWKMLRNYLTDMTTLMFLSTCQFEDYIPRFFQLCMRNCERCELDFDSDLTKENRMRYLQTMHSIIMDILIVQ